MKGSLDQLNVFDWLLQEYQPEETVVRVIERSESSRISVRELSAAEIRLLSSFYSERISQLSKNDHGDGTRQLRVMIVLGASLDSTLLMLASCYLGAHHSVCFPELELEALKTRLEIFRPDVAITVSGRLETLKEAIQSAGLKEITSIVACDDFFGSACLRASHEDYSPEPPKKYSEDDSLFTLFTSGSTGRPKAIEHSVRPYLEYAKWSTQYYFGISKGLALFTATDAAWINGHTYALYGPLLCGGIGVFCSFISSLSNIRLLEECLDKSQTDCFYTSVTLLRMLKAQAYRDGTGSICLKKQLNRIGSCGEPLANEVGKWAIDFFQTQRSTIVNTYFQTETGGILCAPRDEDGVPECFCSVGKPTGAVRIAPAVEVMTSKELDDEELSSDELLVIGEWGGIFKRVDSDRPTKYLTKRGHFRLHDSGYYDKDGFLYIGGRIDDVINVSGHRISTAEVEDVVTRGGIRESCVIGVPDNIQGFAPVLFISPEEGARPGDGLAECIEDEIARKLSPAHRPIETYLFKELPKTKSGKIMRRLMRDVCTLGRIDSNVDISTIQNRAGFLDCVNNFREACFVRSGHGLTIKLVAQDRVCEVAAGIIQLTWVWLRDQISRVDDSDVENKFIIEGKVDRTCVSPGELVEEMNMLQAMLEVFINNQKELEWSNYFTISKDHTLILQMCLAGGEDSTNHKHINVRIVSLPESDSGYVISRRVAEMITISYGSDIEKKDMKSIKDYASVKMGLDQILPDAVNTLSEGTCFKCGTNIKELKRIGASSAFLNPVLTQSGWMLVCRICLDGDYGNEN